MVFNRLFKEIELSPKTKKALEQVIATQRHHGSFYWGKIGVPKGIRTPVAGVKGLCPGPG